MRWRVVAAVALIGLAGCGPTPPQAPKPQAQKLDTALGGISYACGQAYQVSAFGGDPRAFESTAASSVGDLAAVYKRNPSWIYQSETVRQIVHSAASTLDDCGLHSAARRLIRSTG